MRKLYFVIPAYNEEASVGDLIQMIDDVCNHLNLKFSIIIVDDGSDDGTALVAQDASKEFPILLISNRKNSGLGYTIRRGLQHASELCEKNDLIVTLDADLTQDPKYISNMLEEINKGANVVIASRYRKGSGTEGLAFHRHLLSIGASLFMLILFPIKNVRDYSCGFRMYTAPTIKWAFNKYGENFVTEQGFACMVEIAARLRPYARFKEIPFILRYGEKRKPSAMKIAKTIRAYARVIRRVRSANA